MGAPDIDKATAEAEAEADFAGEHDSPSYASEQQDQPGMEPEEETPDGLGGMDLDDRG
jgi:hypothetical protein